MSTLVVQERHLWLNLAEMRDVDKARFLVAPISQVGLFGITVEGFARQFSALQQQTAAIQPILPRRDAPSTAVPGPGLSLPVTVGAPCGAPRVPARPQVVQEVDEAALTWATRRCWSLLFLRRRENSAAPSPGGGPRGESSVSFCFCSHFLKERAISFSSGFSGPWDDSVQHPASTALLCPVRALRIYVDRTRSFRSSEQLFVCHGGQQ